MHESIMDDFLGRTLSLITEFPIMFARIPAPSKRTRVRILTGYTEADPEYACSCVRSSCSNAPGFEWLANAPVIWVFSRLSMVPLGMLVSIMMLPFVILLGAVCLTGEICGKERGWLV